MSWLISAALMKDYENSRSSQGQAAAFSQASGWDGAPSAPLSVTPTPHKFWRNDKTMEPSDLSRFGLTCAVLTDDRGADLLTWYREVSLARTSALPEREPESTGSAAASGPTWPGSLARFDPVSASWKTAQPSLLEDLGESSVIWPRSGMTAAGRCWELPMSERRTKGTGSGLLLPTPTTLATSTNKAEQTYQRDLQRIGNPTWQAVLAVAARKWPTPTAHNAKEMAAPSEYQRNTPTLAAQAGGALNPPWVEWLMGWPIGWTDLRPLATDRCHSAPPLLGNG